MSTRALPDRAFVDHELAELVADRPLGPVFECRFEAEGLPVHVSVVQGPVDLLEAARETAEDLLARWLGGGPLAEDHPETMLLRAVVGGDGWDQGPALRRLAPAVTADLVARDLVEDGALGASVRVGDDAAFVGIPPRPEGWRVQVPDAEGRPQLLTVEEGGVATRGAGPGRVTTTADRAWRAAAEAIRLVDRQTAGSSTSRSAPA